MRSRLSLLALGSALLLSTACHRHAPVRSEHVQDPGLHVVAGPDARSVAWITERQTRVCTTRAEQGSHHRPGHHPEPGHAPDPGAAAARPPGPPHGGPTHAGPAQLLDTLLFRLCEARGNGDISAEQYAQTVQSLTGTIEKMAEAHVQRSRRGARGPDAGGWRRRLKELWREGHHDRDDDGPECGRCKGKHPHGEQPAVGDEHHGPPPKRQPPGY